MLKTFDESLGLNPDEFISIDALIMPHRTIVDSKHRTIEIMNQSLKQESSKN